MLLRLSSSIKVQIKYVFLRGDTLYWQRRVPKDLEDRYGGSKLLKINLNTNDLNKAAKQVESLNRQHEATWEAMRGNQEVTPANLRQQALLLLKRHNLTPYPAQNDEAEVEHFIANTFQEKKESRALESDYPEVTYNELLPEDYASPVEVKALELLTTKPEFMLSEAAEFYLDHHENGSDLKLREQTTAAWGMLVKIAGDKPFVKASRADANSFVASRVAEGVKTGTIRRQLKSISAVFNKVILEKELHRPNPFRQVTIPNEGKDAEEGLPLTMDDLKKTQDSCQTIDDEIRWIVAMQSDLGCRIAEVVGLGMDDIHLDKPVPYVSIRPRPWRRLKEACSERNVPLVGKALWAAQRVVAVASEGQQMAFPRYCKEEKCNADGAGATINKYLQSDILGMAVRKHTTHDFRHTMADRLREVQCPADIRKMIGGWDVPGRAEIYGQGYSLAVMKEWLDKVVLAEVE